MVLNDHHITAETEEAILEFNMELCACIESICGEGPGADEKIAFLKRLSRNIGHSALCLSGGVSGPQRAMVLSTL